MLLGMLVESLLIHSKEAADIYESVMLVGSVVVLLGGFVLRAAFYCGAITCPCCKNPFVEAHFWKRGPTVIPSTCDFCEYDAKTGHRRGDF